MKKIFILVILIICLISFAACSSSSVKEEKQQQDTSQSSDTSKDSAGDNYPEKSVQLVVAYGAGGGTDSMARLLAAELEQKWGKSVVVVNKPGGNSQVGVDAVLDSPNDGYTLGIITNVDIPALIIFGENVSFGLDDFEYIARPNVSSNVLVSSPQSGLKSWEDVKQAAESKPGELTVAISGVAQDLYKLMDVTGIELTPVSFSSGAERVNAVIGGHCDFSVSDKKFVEQFSDAGCGIMGVFSNERLSIIPDIPTFKEQGVDVVNETYRVLYAPKGTPKDIVDKIANDIEEITETDGFKEKLLAMSEVGSFMKTDELKDSVKNDYDLMYSAKDKIKK